MEEDSPYVLLNQSSSLSVSLKSISLVLYDIFSHGFRSSCRIKVCSKVHRSYPNTFRPNYLGTIQVSASFRSETIQWKMESQYKSQILATKPMCLELISRCPVGPAVVWPEVYSFIEQKQWNQTSWTSEEHCNHLITFIHVAALESLIVFPNTTEKYRKRHTGICISERYWVTEKRWKLFL